MEYSNYDVLTKLLDFKTKLKGIEKKGKNAHQNFNYFKLSDLFDEITDMIEKDLNILVTCNIKHKQDDIFNCNLMFFDVELYKSFVFEYDLPLDTQQKNRVQAGGSLWTYAYRYGLQMFFNITDNQDDPDSKDSSKKYNGNKEIAQITKEQYKELSGLLKKANINNASDIKDYLIAFDPTIKSAADLSKNIYEKQIKPDLLEMIN
jgi:hypothetical protein